MLGGIYFGGQPLAGIQIPTPSTAFVLTADFGSFTLTGRDAQLLFDRVLLCDHGNFNLTGQDAQLLFSQGKILVADVGIFILTGQDAQLIYTPVTPPIPPTGGGGSEGDSTGTWFVEQFNGPAPRLVKIAGIVMADPRDREGRIGNSRRIDAYSGPTHLLLRGGRAKLQRTRLAQPVQGKFFLQAGGAKLTYTPYTFIYKGGFVRLRVYPSRAQLEYTRMDDFDLEDLRKLAELALSD